MATPNIFSVSPSMPFLQATVEALLCGQLIPGFQADDDPLALADVTIYVPTRRAARTLPDVLRQALAPKPPCCRKSCHWATWTRRSIS